MRAYLLTILSAVTLFSAYGASFKGIPPSTKTNVGTFAQGDTGDIYTINVLNSGMPTCCAPVVVTDTLPTGLSNPVVKSVPAGYTCSVMGVTLTCMTSNVIATGEIDMIVFTVDVSKTAPATITNSATISGGGAATVTISDANQVITPMPSLTITKTQSSPSYNGTPLPITYGQSVTYRIDVANQGGAPTVGPVTVVDTVASDMVITSVTGGSFTCTHNTTMATCTDNTPIPATSSASPIFVTATLLGNNASDTATVSGGGSASATTPTFSTTTDTFSSVTITSNTGYVYTDGSIYPSPVTMQWDSSLNHTIYGYPNCKITAISGFKILESQPATAPYIEVTGKATSSNISETCQ